MVEPAQFSEEDERWMRRALQLARRGAGRVSPNPMVGAVVVRQGVRVGEGYHVFDGVEHAEQIALGQAGRRARGGVLYCTLEPCFHHGRTPPCCEAIIQAGVDRVVASIEDPNPLVAGKGLEALRAAGVAVEVGLMSAQAQQLNEAFIHWIGKGSPFVLLKLAMTMDGKIATRSGDAKWISGPVSRQVAHRLRYEFDAILVGVRTVLRDDPSLDVRWRRRNGITKIVLDSRLRTPVDATLFRSGDPVVLVHAKDAPTERRRNLDDRAHLLEAPANGGLLDWKFLLRELGREKGIVSLLIEGGGQVAASALQARIVNKTHFFYAPKLFGGLETPAVAGDGPNRVSEALTVAATRVRRRGVDWEVVGYPDWSALPD